ncbi:UNVERIFIED_CONTAM: hypothetical protein Sradi_2346000 [Sesamum radiatum]|uniref:Uncharacterized protein n=1 Tax=Sesamum radiatum TaxID=300843 RepID=A0AAW2T6R6_SESRA
MYPPADIITSFQDEDAELANAPELDEEIPPMVSKIPFLQSKILCLRPDRSSGGRCSTLKTTPPATAGEEDIIASNAEGTVFAIGPSQLVNENVSLSTRTI